MIDGADNMKQIAALLGESIAHARGAMDRIEPTAQREIVDHAIEALIRVQRWADDPAGHVVRLPPGFVPRDPGLYFASEDRPCAHCSRLTDGRLVSGDAIWPVCVGCQKAAKAWIDHISGG